MKDVSIIVPFYNGLVYLEDCFDSIMEQNLAADSYEVLCMGDAPEEGIVSVIDKYEQVGMPVRYVQWFENKGVSYARNRGLSMAEGEYIYFLDSDDYMTPGCLNRLIECARNNESLVVRGDIVWTDDNRSVFDVNNHASEFVKNDKKGTDAHLAALFEREVTVLNMLVKKSVLDENDIKFPDGVRYFSDVSFVMELLMNVDKYYIAGSAVLAKRKRRMSKSVPSISEVSFRGVNAEKMARDLISVYKSSVSIDNITPKRKNMLCGLLCANVLKILLSDVEISDETMHQLSIYVRDAVKILPNRFETVEKVVLSLTGRRQYMIARRLIRFSERKRKNYFRIIARNMVVMVYEIMYACLPVREKVVVMSSALGRSYAGNPRAIYEEMVREGLDRKYKCVWFYDSKPHNIPGKCRQVRFRGLRYLYYMAVAKFWIFDARQPKFVRKSSKTVYLQTWHGTPLKKIGIDLDNVFMPGENSIEEYREEFRRNAGTWDLLISQNEFSSRIFRRAFDFKGTVLETGYPRNDNLFTHNTQDSVNSIKERLGIPQDKMVILYAPTWRDDDSSGLGIYHFSCALDVSMMKEHFGDSAVLAIKYHYLVRDNIDWSIYGDFVHVFDESEDITDIYLVSDILVTDYSSVMFDYSILGRPMYFYCYDLTRYKNTLRGFYFDYEDTAPGPISYTTEELIQNICGKTADKYKDKYDEFVNRYNPWDDGCASRKVINHMFREG